MLSGSEKSPSETLQLLCDVFGVISPKYPVSHRCYLLQIHRACLSAIRLQRRFNCPLFFLVQKSDISKDALETVVQRLMEFLRTVKYRHDMDQ